MSNQKNIRIECVASSVSFCDLLTLLFIGLKLSGHIHWSWWLVNMPIIVEALVVLFS
jgi:hypothetical protein